MRFPKPFFRAQTQSWYIQLCKQQINLGRDKNAALDQYNALMAGRADLTPNTPAVYLLDRFLEWASRNLKPKTYSWYKGFLQSFAEHIGKRLRVRDVKPHHVTGWLDANSNSWSKTTRHCAIRAVKRAFNWGVDEGHISASPIKKVKRGRADRREVVITPQQWTLILASVKDVPFREFLSFVRETGCQPQEARCIEAAHFDRVNGRIILPRLKSKGETSNRTIYLNDEALQLVSRLVQRYPQGPLLRNLRGKPWTANAIVCRFRRIRERTGIAGLVAYTMRHAYATEALMNGQDSVTVAELMGHEDKTMVAEVYSHLAKKTEFLQRAARTARGQGA